MSMTEDQRVAKECIFLCQRLVIRNGDTEHNRAIYKCIESIRDAFGLTNDNMHMTYKEVDTFNEKHPCIKRE